MKRSTLQVAAVLAAATLTACRATARGPVPVQPHPDSAAAAHRHPPAAAESARRGYTGADVRFMQGMIAHHAQALEMTSLVPARSSREDVRLIAQRIDVSQQDEIALMRRWLEDHGEQLPAPDAMHAHHPAAGAAQAADSGPHALMPGMLTPREMAQLAAATGPEFDRLFLDFMIRHHEGALAMVAELLATPGAGQEPEVFRFASDVDADQRAEIRRMRTIQGAPPDQTHRR